MTDKTWVQSAYVKASNGNDWSTHSVIGCILGFGIFGLAYVFTVFSIFVDIAKKKVENEQYIENDKKTL